MMKPHFQTEQGKRLYRICKIMAVTLGALYLLTWLIVTLIAALDDAPLASPVWGLFFLCGSLPLVLPLAAAVLLARRILIVKTNNLSPQRQKAEIILAIATYALVFAAAFCGVLWLAGLYVLMYVAIALLVLALLIRIPYLILQKKKARPG
ncbi:MAG: hypothetical protein IJW51_03395 [Clostridia bacterium]|nr:hypothetical protein [Clostridia bacterium]